MSKLEDNRLHLRVTMPKAETRFNSDGVVRHGQPVVEVVNAEGTTVGELKYVIDVTVEMGVDFMRTVFSALADVRIAEDDE